MYLIKNLPTNIPYLSLIWLLPLIGALIIMFIPREQKNAMRWTAAIFAGASFFVALLVFFGYNPDAPGYLGTKMQFVEKIAWLPQVGMTYFLGADGISLPLLVLNGLVIFTGVFISWNIEDRVKEYFVLLLILVVGVYGVFMSLDLFLMFVFYELAVLPMYLLIGIWGSTRKEYGAMKLTIYLMIGSALVIVGMVAVYVVTGTFDMVVLSQTIFSRTFQIVFFLPIFVGFAVLAGMFPFHTWSPTGHVAAPTAVSMLHAGVLMKLGAYGALRVGLWLMPAGAQYWLPFIAVITLMNVVYGASIAMVQRDFKYVIGYSSVSHMGLVMLALAAANETALNGAVMQMFAHGVMTALFFAVVGRMVYERTHTRQLPELGGLMKVMPFAFVVFIIASLSSMGMPGTAGFMAEFTIFTGVMQFNPWIAAIAAISIPITAAYVLRVGYMAFMGEVKDPHFYELPPLTWQEKFAGTTLAIVVIGVGLFPSIIMDLIGTGVEPIAQRILDVAPVLAGR
ncbi:MAG: NADH-quinone oxidoreductase subunit M [Herpetosiphonaceae bacterium]|nr:NADH-quinone oxidoreductase subunit M [Herpetosiphonaceae bacterium]